MGQQKSFDVLKDAISVLEGLSNLSEWERHLKRFNKL